MTTDDSDEGFWYSGKVTRRRLLGYGAAAPARSAPPCWCRRRGSAAFGQAKPYKIGTLQPLSGAARRRRQDRAGRRADGGRPHQQVGGINGRPVELIVADDESKPDVGRRKAEKLVVEDKIDAHVGGFLSNICLACMPVFEEAQDRQHDQRVPRHHAHHHQVQPLQLPAVRLRAGAGGGVRALPGQQAGQEVAHRLRRLFLGPVDARRLRRARSRRRAARSSAPPASRSAPPT